MRQQVATCYLCPKDKRFSVILDMGDEESSDLGQLIRSLRKFADHLESHRKGIEILGSNVEKHLSQDTDNITSLAGKVSKTFLEQEGN